MKLIRAYWQLILVAIIATAVPVVIVKQANQSCKVDRAAVQEGRLPAATVDQCS